MKDIQQEFKDNAAKIIALDLDRQIMEAVDRNYESRYDSMRETSEIRSNAMSDEIMSDDEMTGIFETEKTLTVRGFLSKLETFLEETLDDTTRGNVFMAENGNGVSLNVVVGAAFADNSDEEINQVNILISPTDKTLLGSDGVSMSEDDAEFVDEDYDDEDGEIDFAGLPL